VKVEILDSARKDLLNGYYFYEKQAPGIGRYFIDSIASDIDSLVDNAGMHPVVFDKFHRLLATRFPFAVYYQVSDETALVCAVLDCRRQPSWIRSSLTPDLKNPK
jgi:plasmid stabilization system protein ParE